MSAAIVAPRSRWTAERRFFTGMSLAMLVVVCVGFARSFFLHPWFPDHPAPTEPIFLVHGVVFAAWSVLLVLQPSLVAHRRLDLHRAFGVAGAVLAAAMVVLGALGALVAANRVGGFIDVPVPPLQFLVIPIVDIGLFAAFVAIALARRRDAQAHKRWMMLATVNLLTAAFARWPGVVPDPLVFFLLADLFIVALAVWDYRTRKALHPATRWGGLTLIVSQPLRLAISGTPAWLAIAAWLTGLMA
jgi:uncharacterized membrane protein YozB (DUF420 family)